MAKEVAGLIKLQIKGGAANPSPPVGPALGSKGINIMDFCKQFNARTQEKAGKVLPVVITYYNDKSFSFIVKTPYNFSNSAFSRSNSVSNAVIITEISPLYKSFLDSSNFLTIINMLYGAKLIKFL